MVPSMERIEIVQHSLNISNDRKELQPPAVMRPVEQIEGFLAGLVGTCIASSGGFPVGLTDP